MMGTIGASPLPSATSALPWLKPAAWGLWLADHWRALLAVALLATMVRAWRQGQRATHHAQAQLLLHWHSWLMQRFGLPHDGQPPATLQTGPLKSHRMLRQKQQFLSGSAGQGRTQTVLGGADAVSHVLHIEAIVHDEQQRFWVFFSTAATGPQSGWRRLIVSSCWTNPPSSASPSCAPAAPCSTTPPPISEPLAHHPIAKRCASGANSTHGRKHPRMATIDAA